MRRVRAPPQCRAQARRSNVPMRISNTRRYSTAAAAAPSVKPSAKADIVNNLKEQASIVGRAEYALFKNIAGGLDVAKSKLFCGKNLTRRERVQVSNSFADLGRLVPLTGVVIVPLAELALPWLAKTFPSLIPTSHVVPSVAELQSKNREVKQQDISQHLLKEAEHEIAHANNDVASAFQRLLVQGGRSLGVRDLHPMLHFFSHHFGLDHLPRAKLQAIASFFGVHTEGTDSFLRISIRARLAELREDDALIHEQGVETLTDAELRDALVARGTPASGKTREERLKALNEWFHVSEQSIPPYLLVLSRAEPYSADELKRASEDLIAAHEAEKRATTIAGLSQAI